MDRPEHTAHRRMIAGEFLIERVEGMRPRIQQIIDERLDMILAGTRPADLVTALAEPVPSQVICELLGIPGDARSALQRYSRGVLSRNGNHEEVKSASAGLKALILDILSRKEGRSDNDLLTRLIQKYRGAGIYDREQMMRFAGALLTAGNETTANMISLGTVALLQHRNQLAMLVNDPTLFRNAVEELLRYLSIADLVTARVAVESLVIGGASISKGEGIVALGAAANHDPGVFDEPGTFNIHRDVGNHVAFGYGTHKCLGQHLARLELEILLTTLFARIPTIRLVADGKSLRVKEGNVIHGVQEVLVTW